MIDFNKNWIFYKKGEEKKYINIPHDAMITEERRKDCVNGDKTGYFPGGIYFYEKQFQIRQEDMGKCIAVLFEGVYQHATISLNEEEIAYHAYGYTQFCVNLSEKLRLGENKLTVQVDNSLEPNSRWYTGSGIYRPVSLTIKDKEHIEDVVIQTKSYSPAVIAVSAKAIDAKVEIWRENTCIVKGEIGEIEIPSAKLWSAEHPNLYTCVIRTRTDEVREDFGIRKIEWNAKTGLSINGEEVLLRGGCIHHDNGVLGACAFADAEERRVRILKEAGYNAIRSAHNPCSKALLEACDRIGMYVMDEAFDGWYTPKTHHDYARDFEKEYINDIHAMVRRDINHPSVIMYSIGNEITETAEERGIRLTKEMVMEVKKLDDTRPVTCGINPMLNILSARGQGIYKETGEYKREPLSPVTNKKKQKESGSALFNAMMQKLNWFTNWMAGSKAGDTSTKKAAQFLDIVGFNYGSRRYDKDVITYPDRVMVGSETLVSELPYNWERVKKHKAIIGDFVWVSWDYLGEAGIGDWTYFSYEGMLQAAGSGAIDLIGTIGAECYFQQIVWGLQKNPYIGVRPLVHGKETPKQSRWRFTNAIDSWSWQGCEGQTAVVEVFSDAHSIKLYKNNKRVGHKKLTQYQAKFSVVYEPGTLVAVAFDKNNKKVSRSILKTSGDETVLTVKVEKRTLKANGQDLCFLSITLADKKGIFKPAKDIPVTIMVEGAGVLQGFGSARCKTNESFHQSTHTTYYGRALAVVRASYTIGKINVKIEAEGCHTKEIEIEVV